MIDFKRSHFEKEIILWGVRWYVAYPISYRQLEEMMNERGVAVDHSTLNRWVIKYAPEFEKVFRRRQRPVGRSWRLDETYVKIKGKWAYLYRAVLRSVPSKWPRARDEGLRPSRSLITWTLWSCTCRLRINCQRGKQVTYLPSTRLKGERDGTRPAFS